MYFEMFGCQLKNIPVQCISLSGSIIVAVSWKKHKLVKTNNTQCHFHIAMVDF